MYFVKIAYRCSFVVSSSNCCIPLSCPFCSVNFCSKPKKNWGRSNENLLAILQLRPSIYASFSFSTLVYSGYGWVPMLELKNWVYTKYNHNKLISIKFPYSKDLECIKSWLTLIVLSLLQSWKSNLRSPRNSTGLLCLFFHSPTLSTKGLNVWKEIQA